MQHSPPPLFKQGASARVKVVFFTVFSITLLLIDSRMKSLGALRQVVGTALYPLQMVALAPRDAARSISDYFASTSTLQKEVAKLREEQIRNAENLHQNVALATENAQLRRLLDLKNKASSKSLMGEILYDARDEVTRKIVLNRGSSHGVALSQPVIDERGVVGQVTRVFPLTCEVTLLSDKNQAIPVQLERNGLRGVVTGRGRSPFLEMRVTTNADIKIGDVLVTSGIDGVYPSGIQVAKVAQVDNKATTTFETALLTPAAGIDQHKQLLILLVDTSAMSPPETEEVRAKKEKINRRITRDATRDVSKEGAPVDFKRVEESASQVRLNAAPASQAVVVPPPIVTAPASSPAQGVKR
ncbi:rod shape-determining protein MreC [Undibacterium cyanobacteriorum]|uniref:Cell shape-determining protein MreC n=1 Tax=Undibacterium cyanobacteriorum TaxID=3073561 RepID=A0ABY9RIT0_9BURK|nr:rod shape-determining protein MreC [Undibacterium sp. 20NA77.5]WMW81092.1 rod shape-determining protein MreC [Undibacterium sp. 20NA77.5]